MSLYLAVLGVIQSKDPQVQPLERMNLQSSPKVGDGVIDLSGKDIPWEQLLHGQLLRCPLLILPHDVKL